MSDEKNLKPASRDAIKRLIDRCTSAQKSYLDSVIKEDGDDTDSADTADSQEEIKASEDTAGPDARYCISISIPKGADDKTIERIVSEAVTDSFFGADIIKKDIESLRRNLKFSGSVNEKDVLSGLMYCMLKLPDIEKDAAQSAKKAAESVLALPSVQDGGLVRLVTKLDSDGRLVQPIAGYDLITSKNELILRGNLPDTTGKTASQRFDLYEQLARKKAIEFISVNMLLSQPGLFEKYFMVEEIEEGGKKTKTIKPTKEFDSLERLYDKVTDEIIGLFDVGTNQPVSGLLSLGESKPVPFYMKIKTIESDDGLSQELVSEVGKSYLEETKDTRVICIDVPRVADGNFSDDYLTALSEQVICKVIDGIVIQGMKESKNPMLAEYFARNKDTGLAHMTEKGASMLEKLISGLSETVSTAVLEDIDGKSDPFKGYRILLEYSIDKDDSIDVKRTEDLYLTPTGSEKGERILQFCMNDANVKLEEVPSDLREDAMRGFYKTELGRNLATNMIFDNMRNARHPGISSYFRMNSRKDIELTEDGTALFGKLVEKISEDIYQYLRSPENRHESGQYYVKYSFGINKLAKMEIGKIWKREDELKIIKADVA